MDKHRKRILYRILSIILLLICIVCLGLLLVPMIAQSNSDREIVYNIAEYTKKAEEVPDDEAEVILSKAKEYNAKLLRTGSLYSNVDDDDYNSLLRVNDNVMGYINIPSVNIHLCLYHNTDEETIEKGVGHVKSTSLPTGDETAYTILIGHRGVPTNRLFTDLDKVVIGDIFTITVLNRVFKYEVTDIQTILPYQIEDMKFEQGKNKVSLMTCTPYGVNTHRLVVTGVLIDTDVTLKNKSVLELSQHEETDVIHTDIPFEPAIFVFIGFVILFIVYFIVDTIKRKRGRHK